MPSTISKASAATAPPQIPGAAYEEVPFLQIGDEVWAALHHNELHVRLPAMYLYRIVNLVCIAGARFHRRLPSGDDLTARAD